jgi:hypothetical protein
MVNKGIAKLIGQPKNASDMTGGRTTKAESRPTSNSTIAGNHFLEAAPKYGTEGVGK